MRLLTYFDNQNTAEAFCEILKAATIEYQKTQGTSAIEIWIIEEKDVALSKDLLTRFLTNPDDPVLKKMQEDYKNNVIAFESVLKKKREEETRINSQAARSFPQAPYAIKAQTSTQRNVILHFIKQALTDYPVTSVIIFICITLYLLSFFKTPNILLTYFLMFQIGTYTWFESPWTGAIWRFFTPSLLHANILHILFNMWAAWSLGTRIEGIIGAKKYIVLILICAAIPNILQALLVSPHFLGYSGVVFGYAGYLWTRAHYDIHSRFILYPGEIFAFLFWMMLGILQIFGNMANIIHASGLVCGMILGLIAGRGFRYFRRAKKLTQADYLYLAVLFLSIPLALFFEYLFKLLR